MQFNIINYFAKSVWQPWYVLNGMFAKGLGHGLEVVLILNNTFHVNTCS